MLSELLSEGYEAETRWIRSRDGTEFFYGPQVWRTQCGVRVRNGSRWEDIATLPLRPIWPGFAPNTLFYAAILWGLFAAPFALRRRLRIRRGLCPACAYPIGASVLCTECGRPLPQARGPRSM
jgi:hypothetical protein